MTIRIQNLSPQATEDDVIALVSEYGNVNQVTLPTDRQTGQKHGYALVDLSSGEDRAIQELNNSEWMGKQIKVEVFRYRQKH
jgi:RNA recognition motif-containing protein